MLTFETGADADVVQLSHVLLKVEVSAESFGADFTREGFLVVVGVHVKGKVVDLVKCLVTNVAFVGLIATVSQFVVLVVSLLVEAFSAELTNVRLVAGVYPSVCIQR